MAVSTCPKCPSTSFETKTLHGKITLVQCAECGTVVGAFQDVEAKLQEIARKIPGDR